MQTESLVMPVRAFEWPQNPTFRIPKTIDNGKLPSDPRQWSRPQVNQWLRESMRKYGLPEVDPDRFCMNGKGLCLMNQAMFCTRVPRGGDILHKDFQKRLSAALQL